jgi:hypothetical protein
MNLLKYSRAMYIQARLQVSKADLDLGLEATDQEKRHFDD